MKDCVSYESAKALKDAGVVFDVEHAYLLMGDGSTRLIKIIGSGALVFPAPTFCELFDALPDYIVVDNVRLSLYSAKVGSSHTGCKGNYYNAMYANVSNGIYFPIAAENAQSPQDALSELIISCLKMGYLTLEQINGEGV